MKHALIVIGLIALSSCAIHYQKAGSSEQDLQKQLTDCEVKAGQANYPIAGGRKDDFMKQCMEGEGWSVK